MDGWIDSMVWIPRHEIGNLPINAQDLKLSYVTGYGMSERRELLKLYALHDGFIGIPRDYYFRHVGDTTGLEDRRTDGWKVDFNFKSDLRPHQEPLVMDFITEIMASESNGGILNAPCGFGKTVCGLWVISQLERSTLIVVHTSRLFSQWIERVEEHLGITPGVIREDEFDTESPIVIAMLQTLRARKYSCKDMSNFGVLAIDEAHRVAAPHWNEIILNLPMRWRIGLTATPRRKDKLENAFFFNIGPILATTKKREMKPKIFYVQTDAGHKVPTMGNGKVNRARVLTILAKNEGRNRLVTREIVRAVNKDRRILVLSDRLEMFYHIRRILKDHTVPKEKIGWVIGSHWAGIDPDDPPVKIAPEATPIRPKASVLKRVKAMADGAQIEVDRNFIRISGASIPRSALMDLKGVRRARMKDGVLLLETEKSGGNVKTVRIPEAELQENQKRQVILATYGLAAEGLDIPEIDVLLLASPRGDVEQAVGRALRFLPDKRQPVIVDFLDVHHFFHRMKKAREKQYLRLGYEIHERVIVPGRGGK